MSCQVKSIKLPNRKYEAFASCHHRPFHGLALYKQVHIADSIACDYDNYYYDATLVHETREAFKLYHSLQNRRVQITNFIINNSIHVTKQNHQYFIQWNLYANNIHFIVNSE